MHLHVILIPFLDFCQNNLQLKYLMLYGCKDIIALDNLKNSNLEELCITDCCNLQIKVPPSVKRCFVDVPSQSTVLF